MDRKLLPTFGASNRRLLEPITIWMVLYIFFGTRGQFSLMYFIKIGFLHIPVWFSSDVLTLVSGLLRIQRAENIGNLFQRSLIELWDQNF